MHNFRPFFISLFALVFIGGTLASAKVNSPTPKKIVILGDSLTAGYGVEKDAAFPALIRKKFLEKGMAHVEIIDSGISGSTSASGPGRLQWLLKGSPDFLLLELGANDGLRGQDLASTKTNLRTTIQLAKKQGMKVALVAMQLPANYGADYAKRFAAIFNELSREEKVDIIPFFFSELLTTSKKKLLLADGLHPNEEGHKLIADKLFEYLVKLI